MAAGAGLTLALLERRADAALARGLSVAELLGHSSHTLIGVPLRGRSDWAILGKRRVIVTDTRVRVEALVGGGPAPAEVVVRVLGGVIGNLGALVDGQAVLTRDERCLLFLTAFDGSVSFVTGAAQGHYPFYRDNEGAERLRTSPRLPRLLQPEGSAAARLYGRTVAEARLLLQSERP